jgi:hypothetical protein
MPILVHLDAAHEGGLQELAAYQLAVRLLEQNVQRCPVSSWLDQALCFVESHRHEVFYSPIIDDFKVLAKVLHGSFPPNYQ